MNQRFRNKEIESREIEDNKPKKSSKTEWYKIKGRKKHHREKQNVNQ